MNEQINSSLPNNAVKSGHPVAAFVLGIVGLIAWVLPILGVIVSVTGLVLGIKGLRSAKRGLAMAAILLSVVGLVATVVNASIGAYLGATGRHPIVNRMLEEKKPAGNQNLTQIAEEEVRYLKMNMTLPIEMEPGVTLVDVTAEDGAIRYHYVLAKADPSQISNDSLKVSLSAGVCGIKETQDILDQGVNMEYSYLIKDSTQTYFVSLSKTDCQ
jgi:hypothetical protein